MQERVSGPALEHEVTEVRVRVEAAQILEQHTHQQLVRTFGIAPLPELDGLEGRVVIRLPPGQRAPRDRIHLVPGARLRGELAPERRVRVRIPERLVARAQILELAPVERQRHQPERRDVDPRALDLSRRVRGSPEAPALLDLHRDDLAGHDLRDAARAQRDLRFLAGDPDPRRRRIDLEHGGVDPDRSLRGDWLLGKQPAAQIKTGSAGRDRLDGASSSLHLLSARQSCRVRGIASSNHGRCRRITL